MWGEVNGLCLLIEFAIRVSWLGMFFSVIRLPGFHKFQDESRGRGGRGSDI